MTSTDRSSRLAPDSIDYVVGCFFVACWLFFICCALGLTACSPADSDYAYEQRQHAAYERWRDADPANSRIPYETFVFLHSGDGGGLGPGRSR